MGLVGVWVGWLVFVAVRRVLPSRPLMVVPAASLAALVSVPTAAFAFSLLFELGGTVDVPFSTVATAMVGVHSIIGVGEAVITGLAVLSIVAVRPDLVHGARPSLERRTLTIRAGVAA
jgi:cobalt/nickel transport system permease protein